MSMNISELFHKGKEKLKELTHGDLYIVAVIIFVGFAGFGLGRLSLIEQERKTVQIEYPEYLSTSVLSAEDSTGGTVVPSAESGLLIASKNGSKYHFPWCSGGKRILEKNKIWFDSAEEARKAGYTPAANCKGLK